MKNLRMKYWYYILIILALFYAMTSFGQCSVSPSVPNNDCYYATIMADPYCCNIGWDGLCQNRYNNCNNSNCSVIPPNHVIQNSCYYYVLSIDPWCCNMEWDGLCQFSYDDCIPINLPIELKEFTGVYNGDNYLSWTTSTERNNDYFTLEHSIDGENWKLINTQSGAGTTNNEQTYSYIHRDYEPVINYYRLSQTDYDGTTEIFTSNIVSIDNTNSRYIVKYINTIGQEVSMDNVSGIYLIVYSDGTIKKQIK